jgi:hypothetical protein
VTLARQLKRANRSPANRAMRKRAFQVLNGQRPQIYLDERGKARRMTLDGAKTIVGWRAPE